jgi:hypothetical protein
MRGNLDSLKRDVRKAIFAAMPRTEQFSFARTIKSELERIIASFEKSQMKLDYAEPHLVTIYSEQSEHAGWLIDVIIRIRMCTRAHRCSLLRG